MERDFMGLAVKQETSDEAIDDAPLRISAMQWSFANKASSVPQLLSFQAGQEDNHKTGFDSLTSTGLVTLTKNIVHRPATNQTHPMLSTGVSSQPLAGVSMTSPVPTIPSTSTVVGTTDLRNGSKISGAPAQLTIFYNGSVCVFDNISPEKAQAIMLLAGNGSPMTSNATLCAAPLQAKLPRSSILDGLVVSQSYGTTMQRCSPVTVTSIGVPQSPGPAAKPIGVPVSSSNFVGPLKVANSLGPISATFLSSDTVPQFRRKSLARFLEKRKERVISASPYGDNKSPEGMSMNSSGSCPVPAIN